MKAANSHDSSAALAFTKGSRGNRVAKPYMPPDRWTVRVLCKFAAFHRLCRLTPTAREGRLGSLSVNYWCTGVLATLYTPNKITQNSHANIKINLQKYYKTMQKKQQRNTFDSIKSHF